MLARLLGWLRGTGDAVYWYHDGRKWRKADPLAVGRKLEEICPDYKEILAFLWEDVPIPGKLGEDVERQKKDAQRKLVEAARAVFGLAEVEQGGRTDAGAFGVLADWIVAIAAMAEEARPFANLRQRDAPLT